MIRKRFVVSCRETKEKEKRRKKNKKIDLK